MFQFFFILGVSEASVHIEDESKAPAEASTEAGEQTSTNRTVFAGKCLYNLDTSIVRRSSTLRSELPRWRSRFSSQDKGKDKEAKAMPSESFELQQVVFGGISTLDFMRL